MSLNRSYVQHSRAWYRDRAPNPAGIVDVIMVSVRGEAPDGLRPDAEFAIEWHDLGNCVAARLAVYDEAWAALNRCRDLLDGLEALVARAGRSPIPEEVVVLMDGLGFTDCTSVLDQRGRSADDLLKEPQPGL